MQFQERRTGQSTRLIDLYIQELFLTGKITVKDHHEHMQAHTYLFDRIRDRMDTEHRGIEIACNKGTLTIALSHPNVNTRSKVSECDRYNRMDCLILKANARLYELRKAEDKIGRLPKWKRWLLNIK